MNSNLSKEFNICLRLLTNLTSPIKMQSTVTDINTEDPIISFGSLLKTLVL